MPSNIHPQNNPHISSELLSLTLQVAIGGVYTKVYVRMPEDIYDESIQTSSTRANHRFFSTEVNAILEPHSFEYQCNVLTYIVKHSSLYEHFKIIGGSTPKLCKFSIIYFDNMAKITEPLGWFMMNNNVNVMLKCILCQQQTQLYIQNQQNLYHN